MSETHKKGRERGSSGLIIGGTMVARTTGSADMLIWMVVMTGTFDGGELEGKTDWVVVVFPNEAAIATFRKHLCAFLRDLFVALVDLVTRALTYEADGSGTLVAMKGIICSVFMWLVVIWGRTLRARDLLVQGRRGRLRWNRGTEVFHL